MNRAFSHFWPEETPEDGEMSEMTLPSRHRIRNSSPGGLRQRPSLYLSVTKAPHNTEFNESMAKKNIFVSFKPPIPGSEPRAVHDK